MISVIVASTTGSFEKTKFCLKSLLEQKTKQNFEVLLINDGYDEKITSLVQTYKKYFDIKYFDRQKDFCVSRSRNIGAKEAKKNYLIFLDSDISLNQNAIDNYFDLISNNKNASIWGECGSKKQPDKRLPLFNKDFENYINSPRNIIIYFHPYSFAFSANFGLSKESFIKSGGFNEEFFGYGCEDIEFGYRLYKMGLKYLFSQKISGLHLHTPRGSSFYDDENIKNNVNRIFKIVMNDIKKFYLIDEKIVLKEFEYLSNFVNEKIYFYYVMYFLSKNNKDKALEYTKESVKYPDKINIEELSNLWEQYYMKQKNNELMIWF